MNDHDRTLDQIMRIRQHAQLRGEQIRRLRHEARRRRHQRRTGTHWYRDWIDHGGEAGTA